MPSAAGRAGVSGWLERVTVTQVGVAIAARCAARCLAINSACSS